MRKQPAIYWPPAPPDNYGRAGVSALVELILIPNGGGNFRVRWEDAYKGRVEDFGTVRQASTSIQGSIIVYVPALPGGGEVEVGGFLWLGLRANLTDELVPKNNPNAREIRAFEKVPDFKANQFIRTCYL